MQPLDVSIFGPLTSAYRRLVSHAAEHLDAIDKAQFGTFYAEARSKVLTQSAARKAFSDSGITLGPSPEKVLQCLAGASTSSEAFVTPQRLPLQEVAIPHSNSAFNAVPNATLNAHAQEPGSRDARMLKQTVNNQTRLRRRLLQF